MRLDEWKNIANSTESKINRAKIKGKIRWTYETTKLEASKYKNRSEFRAIKNKSPYSIACRNGWLDEWFPLEPGDQGYWNVFENVHKEALKYKHRNEFFSQSNGAWASANKKGWLDGVCSHMERPDAWQLKWTKEEITNLARDYDTKLKFRRENPSAYVIACRNGWWDEISEHMISKINKDPKYIYLFSWEDVNLFYVGLTWNHKIRKRNHLWDIKCIVNKTMQKYGEPKFKVLTKRPVKYDKAGEAEDRWIKIYEDKGWEKINIAPAGSLGGNISKWNLDNIRDEAKKYKNRSELQKHSCGAYNWALKNKLLDKFYPPNLENGSLGYWDIKENIIKVLKSKPHRSLTTLPSGAYKGVVRNNWNDELKQYLVDIPIIGKRVLDTETNIVYDSMTQCCKDLGIKLTTLHNRIKKAKRFKRYNQIQTKLEV